MAGLTLHRGKMVVLEQDNVDTDRIIPARFLTMVTRTGYGELLFKDVRGEGFPLDQPAAQGASILVAGTNFGCGSSREHAVWAIQQAGFQVVIAKRTETSPGYSDIFRGNAGNCGLCLIELPEPDWAKIAALPMGTELEVSLEHLAITTPSETIAFTMSPATRHQLMMGLDLVGMTLVHAEAIDAYEKSQSAYVPARSDV